MKKFPNPFSSTYYKKTAVLALFLLFCAFTVPVSAHPPSEMILEYDTDAQLLTVTLTHSVSDPSLHFIYRIDISLNGFLMIQEEYINQSTNATFFYTYPLDAQSGDSIYVFAECNLGGSLTDTLVVGQGLSSKTPPQLWPFHAVFMTGGLLLMVVALFNILQKAPPAAWLKAHKTSGTLSVLLVITGLIIGLYMVSQSGGGHFRVLHAYSGGLTLIVSFLTPLLGFTALKKRRDIPSLRPLHIWTGRIAIFLIIMTVVSGLYQAGLL
jgi:hypothetical protein